MIDATVNLLYIERVSQETLSFTCGKMKEFDANINFGEYQKLSGQTAIFPEIDAELADACLKLLISASKIAGIVKKIYRDKEGQMSSEVKNKLTGALAAHAEDYDVVDYLVSKNVAENHHCGSSPFPAATYPLLGYADEVGELIEKALESSDRQELAGELGDTLWYAAQVANVFQVDMGAIAAANLEKVFSRHQRNVIKGDGDNR